MPNIVKDLLLSKKFIVALLTGAGAVAAYLGWNVDLTKVIVGATPFLIYIGAQGWADGGVEKSKIDQDTELKLQASAQQHEKDMAGIHHANAVVLEKLRPVMAFNAINSAASKEAGFARLGVMLLVSAFAGVLSLASMSCAHPGQSTLQAGQCLLDNGVLLRVIANLGQPGYAQLIADLPEVPGLIDCALQAVAAQDSSPVAAQSKGVAPAPPAVVNVIARRAREVIETRKAAKPAGG